jgi:hypothetical protein
MPQIYRDSKGPHRSRDRAGRPYRAVHGSEYAERPLAEDRQMDRRALGGLVAAIFTDVLNS